MTPMIGMPQGGEWLILLVVVLLLFGAKKLPDLARSLGRSARILKTETKGLHDDDAIDGEVTTAPAALPATTDHVAAPSPATPAPPAAAPAPPAAAPAPAPPAAAPAPPAAPAPVTPPTADGDTAPRPDPS